MSKGKAKHEARLAAVQVFGKDLARRAGRKCELCESNDDLRIHDRDPEAKEPDMETLLLLCSRCRALTGGRKDEPQTLRFLEGAIWSDVPPVAATARELLRTVNADWARGALELLPE